jgi:hypothetical protein
MTVFTAVRGSSTAARGSSTAARAVVVTLPTPSGPVTVELGKFMNAGNAGNALLAVQWAAVTAAEHDRPGSAPWWYVATVDVDGTSRSNVLDAMSNPAAYLADCAIPILCGLFKGTLSLAEANQRTLSDNGFGRIHAVRGPLVDPWTEEEINELKRAVDDQLAAF